MRIPPLAAALAAFAGLAGCATPAYVSPVEVTRFTAPASAGLASGTITVRPAPGQAETFGFAAYRAAVSEELGQLGYTVGASGGQFADISIERFVAQQDGRRSPVDVGVGGSTGSYGSGVGVGVGINLNSLAGPPADRIETEMRVTIRPATGTDALWEGRARFTATSNSDFASEQAAAAKLADALFAGFPGQSGETIEVQ
jgi:hypothetical protein